MSIFKSTHGNLLCGGSLALAQHDANHGHHAAFVLDVVGDGVCKVLKVAHSLLHPCQFLRTLNVINENINYYIVPSVHSKKRNIA